jgi:hypothetical protein
VRGIGPRTICPIVHRTSPGRASLCHRATSRCGIMPTARKTDTPTRSNRHGGGGRHPRLSLLHAAKSWVAGLRPP